MFNLESKFHTGKRLFSIEYKYEFDPYKYLASDRLILLFMFYKQKIIRHKKYIWSILLTLSVISEPLLLRPFFLIFIISGFVNIFTKINNQKVVL